MSVEMGNTSALSDWPHEPGWQHILPVLVEHAVAEHHWGEDHGTEWLGGNHQGFDVWNRCGRTDAKKAWFGADPERVYFAAPDGGFDLNHVDFVAPVVLDEPRIRYEALQQEGGRITATYASAQLWVIPVSVVNEVLRRHAKGRSSVPLNAIAGYQVPRGQHRCS